MTAVVTGKLWHVPDTSCMDLATYVTLSHEDKVKLYENSLAKYKQSHPDLKYQRARDAATEKITKYFKSVKAAPDRIELFSLQKWYCETRDKVSPPTEKNLEDYFYQKSILLVYSAHQMIDQLGLVRKEAADMLRLLSQDIFSHIDEISCSGGLT